jgi:hypothetical protein
MTEIEQLQMMLNEALNMHQRNLEDCTVAMQHELYKGHHCDFRTTIQAVFDRSWHAIKTNGAHKVQPASDGDPQP